MLADEKFERALKRAEKREVDHEFTQLCVERLKKVHNIDSIKQAQESHLFSLGQAMMPHYTPVGSVEKRMKGIHKNKDLRQMFGNRSALTPTYASAPMINFRKADIARPQAPK